MDPRTAVAVCGAAAEDLERQRAALHYGGPLVLRALTANPALSSTLVEEVADRIANTDDRACVISAASAQLRAALAAHPDLRGSSLCEAPWLTIDDLVAVVERSNDDEAVAWSAMRAAGCGYRAGTLAFSELPDNLADAIARAVARTPNVGHWNWVGEHLFAISDRIRALGEPWMGTLPATDNHHTLGLAVTRYQVHHSTRSRIEHLDALSHPACDAELVTTIIERFVRGDTPGRQVAMRAALLDRVAAAHPEHLAAALRAAAGDLDHAGLSDADRAMLDGRLEALCVAHPACSATVSEFVRGDVRFPRSGAHAISSQPELAAALRWSEIAVHLDGGATQHQVWAAAANSALSALFGDNLDAAFTLLANGFDSTLGELVDTLDGVTAPVRTN